MQPKEEESDVVPDHYMKYFMQEIRYSEVIITEGDLEGGVDHLIRTIVECNKPEELFRILQQTLPLEVLALFIYKLISYNEKVKSKPDDIESVILRDVNLADLWFRIEENKRTMM